MSRKALQDQNFYRLGGIGPLRTDGDRWGADGEPMGSRWGADGEPMGSRWGADGEPIEPEHLSLSEGSAPDTSDVRDFDLPADGVDLRVVEPDRVRVAPERAGYV
jgi:hypothetical protein